MTERRDLLRSLMSFEPHEFGVAAAGRSEVAARRAFRELLAAVDADDVEQVGMHVNFARTAGVEPLQDPRAWRTRRLARIAGLGVVERFVLLMCGKLAVHVPAQLVLTCSSPAELVNALAAFEADVPEFADVEGWVERVAHAGRDVGIDVGNAVWDYVARVETACEVVRRRPRRGCRIASRTEYVEHVHHALLSARSCARALRQLTVVRNEPDVGVVDVLRVRHVWFVAGPNAGAYDAARSRPDVTSLPTSFRDVALCETLFFHGMVAAGPDDYAYYRNYARGRTRRVHVPGRERPPAACARGLLLSPLFRSSVADVLDKLEFLVARRAHAARNVEAALAALGHRESYWAAAEPGHARPRLQGRRALAAGGLVVERADEPAASTVAKNALRVAVDEVFALRASPEVVERLCAKLAKAVRARLASAGPFDPEDVGFALKYAALKKHPPADDESARAVVSRMNSFVRSLLRAFEPVSARVVASTNFAAAVARGADAYLTQALAPDDRAGVSDVTRRALEALLAAMTAGGDLAAPASDEAPIDAITRYLEHDR